MVLGILWHYDNDWLSFEGKKQWQGEWGEKAFTVSLLCFCHLKNRKECEIGGKYWGYSTSFIQWFSQHNTATGFFQNPCYAPSKSHTKSQKCPTSPSLGPFGSTIHGKKPHNWSFWFPYHIIITSLYSPDTGPVSNLLTEGQCMITPTKLSASCM